MTLTALMLMALAAREVARAAALRACRLVPGVALEQGSFLLDALTGARPSRTAFVDRATPLELVVEGARAASCADLIGPPSDRFVALEAEQAEVRS